LTKAVINLKPAKSLQGKLDLPPSPDLFLLTLTTALALSKNVKIISINETPLLKMWSDIFKNHLNIEWNDNSCLLAPHLNDPSSYLLMPYRQLPFRDLVVFTALGMGKVVSFKDISKQRLETWCKNSKKFNIVLEIVQHGENYGLSVKEFPETFSDISFIEEADLSMLLGFLLGKRRFASFQIDYPFSNPLRNLASLLGFNITVKSAVSKENDPIARRMKFLQSKKRQTTSSGQQYIVNADFSQQTSADNLEISLPGDEQLGSIMIVAKCLLPKGSFVINNMPLETWASPLPGFIRKMGCKLSLQETNRTSFGSAGMLTIQKSELYGRKVECSPAADYQPHLPAMVVLAAFAEGQSVFRDLEDLRNDDPDGIDLIEKCIRTLGARHGEMPDGIVMEGGRDFDGFDITESLSASISGSFAVAALKCIGETNINDEQLCQRWPDFRNILEQICEFRV
jgi:hypothetical protein